MPADTSDILQHIADEKNFVNSVIAFCANLPAIEQAKIDEALAGGATAEQVQAMRDAYAALQPDLDAAVTAIFTNTPQPPPTPAQLASAKK